MTDRPLAVRMSGVTKRYPTVVANRNVSLSVTAGEVHAVVGENGAGKSTLMKILYGLVTPDEGEIEVRGRRLHRHSPADAIRAGVGMVFQHFILVPPLTVAENVVLGAEPTRGPFLDRARAVREVRELSLRFGLDVDPEARVEDCSVGIQQRVEILKVLFRGAEIVILDEPTGVLTPQEVDELIAVIRRLAAQGKALLLVTHKLREVMAAADRVTILRQGEAVETLPIAQTNAAEIAHKMIGRELDTPRRSVTRGSGDAVLEIRELHAESDRGTPALRGIDLTVRQGEIVGVAGIEGNGQTELVECIAGLRRATEGTIDRRGEVAHIPEDRHRCALVLDFSVEENAILGLQRRFLGTMGRRSAEIRRHVDHIVLSCDVRPPDPALPIRRLSGGNQQKVVVGRELARRAKLLIACHPTRGLDVGATEFVMRSLLAERARGAGVLFVSSELSELMAISDRVVVLCGGRIVGDVDPSQVDERRLGLLMTGHP